MTNAESEPPPIIPDKRNVDAIAEAVIRGALAALVIGTYIYMLCVWKWAPPELGTMSTMAFTYFFVGAAGAIRRAR